MPEVLSIIGMLVAVIGILFLAYWCTKFIARLNVRGGMLPMGTERQLQILEQLAVGKDQKLMVVRAGDRYFLTGFSGSGATMLAEFTAEEAQCWKPVETDTGTKETVPGFRESFLAAFNKKRK